MNVPMGIDLIHLLLTYTNRVIGAVSYTGLFTASPQSVSWIWIDVRTFKFVMLVHIHGRICYITKIMNEVPMGIHLLLTYTNRVKGAVSSTGLFTAPYHLPNNKLDKLRLF